MLIEFAAGLQSDSFNITVASARKQDAPFLFLKVEQNFRWNSPAQQWASGYYDYEKQRQVPAVWTGSASPWDSMHFAGPIGAARRPSTSSSVAPKFCGQCGSTLVLGAKFCAGCGSPINAASTHGNGSVVSSSLDRNDFVGGDRLDSAKAKKLAGLVVSAIYSDNTPNERTLLLSFLEKEFVSASIGAVIDGLTSTSKEPITLASLQKLHLAIVSGKPLNGVQAKLAELVLTKAPISLGYWGAFKALLKYQPANVSRTAIGAGFARISQSGRIYNNWWTGGNWENIRILDELMTVPSAKTRYYLSRRGRRELVQLAETDPTAYVEMASGFLEAADREPSSTDFMFGQILYGNGGYLSPRSRSVRSEITSMSLDPYEPALWQKAPEQLNRLWKGVRRSHTIQDFVFRTAQNGKIKLDPIEGSALDLALSSELPELRAFVISQIAATPSVWSSLSTNSWAVFLGEVDAKLLRPLLDSLDTIDGTHSLAAALVRVLEQLNDVTDPRMQILSAMYFTVEPEYQAWGRDSKIEGKAAAALLRSAISISITNANLISSRLGFDGLVVCWNELHRSGKIDDKLSVLFAEAATSLWDESGDYGHDLALQTLAGNAPEWFQNLGSLLISRTWSLDLAMKYIGYCEQLIESEASITSAVIGLLKITPEGDVLGILDSVFSNEAFAGSLSLVELLNTSASVRKIAWSQLERGSDSPLASALISHKQLLTSTLFELNQADCSSARGVQADALVVFLGSPKVSSEVPPEILVGAASNATPALAVLGNKILRKRDLLKDIWLQLAETQMPMAIGFVRAHLLTLSREEISSAVVLAADSAVESVRDLGLELLDMLRDKIDLQFVYSRLAQSNDPVVRSRVAEEALVSPWSDGADLVDFDAELLVTLRRTRGARENIKKRFDQNVDATPGSTFLTEKRIQSLISLTRIGNVRDREWALARIAQLSNSGIEIDGVELVVAPGGSKNV